jgi:hypothetical protein
MTHGAFGEADARDTSRPMTWAEITAWNRGLLPCCGGAASDAIRGPRGGLSINLACPTCDMRINVIDPEAPFGAAPWGQVIREPRN